MTEHRADESSPELSPAGDPPHSGPRRWGRIAAIAAAVVLLLPVVIIAIGAFLLPAEVIARVAAEKAEAALGVPVQIDDLEIALWPVPSAALIGARIGTEEAPVATVDRVLLRPRLLPLLSGQVTVRELTIDRPDIRLVVDSSGALNLPFGSNETPEEASSDASIGFDIDLFRIRDGRLSYRDERDGTDVSVHALEQRLRLDGRVEAGELARIGLTGRLASDSVDALLPGRVGAPLRGIRFAVEHDAELDRTTDRLDLASLRLELQRLALSGSGSIQAVSDSMHRSADLRLQAEEFSFEDLASSVPQGFLAELLAGRAAGEAGDGDDAGAAPSAAGMEYAGYAAIDTRISGPITRDSLPAVTGEVRLREAGVRQGQAQLLSHAGGTIAFSNDRVATEELAGNLFGAPFAASFEVQDLADPRVVFAARGTAELEQLLALLETEEPVQATGRLPFDLQGRLAASDPLASVVEGTIGLGGLRAELPSLLQPVQLSSGTVRFAGERLLLEDVALAFGESRVRATATVADWLPAALGDSTTIAQLRFDATAATLDLDALLGESESEYTPLLFARLADRPIDGRSAAEVATELGLALPELPRLRAEGQLRAERLIRSGLTLQNLEVDLESSPTAVSAPLIQFGLMGGTVNLGLALERGAEGATLVGVYHLENVGAGPFFSRFTPFQGHLDGSMVLQGDASLQLDEQMLPVRPSVRSSGSVAFTSGSLAGWPLLSHVGERLGLQRLDTLVFREWSGDYLIAGPLVSLDRAVQLSDGVQTELAGSFDFAGQLDLGVIARLSPSLAAGASEQIRTAAVSLAGSSGSVPVGLRITGPVESPQISLDLTAARDQALAVARERAIEEAENAARRAAAEVTRRALGDSAAAVAPEQLGESLRSEVQNRIRGFLGRGRGGAAAEPDTAPSADAAESAPESPESSPSAGDPAVPS